MSVKRQWMRSATDKRSGYWSAIEPVGQSMNRKCPQEWQEWLKKTNRKETLCLVSGNEDHLLWVVHGAVHWVDLANGSNPSPDSIHSSPKCHSVESCSWSDNRLGSTSAIWPRCFSHVQPKERRRHWPISDLPDPNDRQLATVELDLLLQPIHLFPLFGRKTMSAESQLQRVRFYIRPSTFFLFPTCLFRYLVSSLERKKKPARHQSPTPAGGSSGTSTQHTYTCRLCLSPSSFLSFFSTSPFFLSILFQGSGKNIYLYFPLFFLEKKMMLKWNLIFH